MIISMEVGLKLTLSGFAARHAANRAAEPALVSNEQTPIFTYI